MKNFYTLFVIVLFFPLFVFSQQDFSYNTSRYSFNKLKSVNVSAIKTDWDIKLTNLDNPREGNKAYIEYIQKIKAEIEQKYPKKNIKDYLFLKETVFNADTPFVISGFEGNIFENSIPNDNSLAVSNNGMLVSAINSNLYFFDTQTDSLLNHISLTAFSDTLQLNPDQYDPKLLYDPDFDRFVIVYLAGFLHNTSNIIVGFSQSNNPLGIWNLYSLPGNPVADTSWSDFPAIALTENELFITVNLLKNNMSWQNAFKQSIIWQIDKNSGYNGTSLQTKLWKDIKFGGKPIRNLNPIQGGNGLKGPDIFLLSNRNFAVQNDSIFLLHISNLLTDTAATLNINALISDRMYGMPPKAWQPQNQRLETNDARILGGFTENGLIQFVGNTIDTLTGFATFYHGMINNLYEIPSIKLTLVKDTLEFGYPNISYTGNSSNDNSSIITVNHSSSKVFPGFSAFYYNGNGEYSKRINLKSGGSYVNLMSGTDRWGDYSGSQRKYNEPGKVWASGSFGKYLHQGINNYRLHGTWLVELKKPDDEITLPVYFDLLAYPNPTSDMIYIEFDIPYNSNINISLYDISGQLVKQLIKGEVTTGKNILSFSTKPLKKGIYLISVKNSEGIFLAKKIIKE